MENENMRPTLRGKALQAFIVQNAHLVAHAVRAVGFKYGRTLTDDDVADLTQEVWFKAARAGIDDPQGDAGMVKRARGFCQTIAGNVVRDYLTGSANREDTATSIDDPIGDSRTPMVERCANPSPDAFKILQVKESLALLDTIAREILSGLDLQIWSALLENDGEIDHDGMALQAGVSPNNVKIRKCRILAKLREEYEDRA